MQNLLSDLGKRVVAARRAKGIAQYKLAEQIGVSTKTLTWIETGHTADPRSSILLRLSDALGVSTDWLLRGDNSSVAEPPRTVKKSTAGTG